MMTTKRRRGNVRNRVAKARVVDPLDDLDDADGRRSWRAWVLEPMRRRPVDTLGLALMMLLILTAMTNALFLQSGKHPAPMRAIGTITAPAPETTGSLVAMPRPRPVEAAPAQPVKHAETPDHGVPGVIADIQRELARKGFYDGAVDGRAGPRLDAAIRHFEQAAGLKLGSAPNEDLLSLIALAKVKASGTKPEPKAEPNADHKTDAKKPHGPHQAEAAPSSSRILAVQRALSDFGYGQLKTTGVIDSATKAAIEKFERERKLPASGKVSDRLMRELASVTGRPLE
jgi:peptidoglycan hydrolase-like protein with peptidoglycan-binding domain